MYSLLMWRLQSRLQSSSSWRVSRPASHLLRSLSIPLKKNTHLTNRPSARPVPFALAHSTDELTEYLPSPCFMIPVSPPSFRSSLSSLCTRPAQTLLLLKKRAPSIAVAVVVEIAERRIVGIWTSDGTEHGCSCSIAGNGPKTTHFNGYSSEYWRRYQRFI